VKLNKFLKVYSKANEDMSRVVLKNAPKSLQMIYPEIQKSIANVLEKKVLKVITDDVGDDF
jgi:hypothetical protein